MIRLLGHFSQRIKSKNEAKQKKNNITNDINVLTNDGLKTSKDQLWYELVCYTCRAQKKTEINTCVSPAQSFHSKF